MQELDYKHFSQKIHQKARARRFPIRAMFELTYRCNHHCIHCYNTEEQKKTSSQMELSTGEVFKILRQLRQIGCFYLGFTGGEIFVRCDILDILWHAKKLGFEIVILTNGSLIDEEMVNELSRLAPNKIDITVHAMDEEVFDKITGMTGSAKKVFKAIKFLHQRNVPLGIKSCGMQQNKNEVVAISKFARSLNTIFRFDGELTPRSDGSKNPYEYLINLEEAYHLRRECYPEMFAEYDDKGRPRKKAKPRKRNLQKLFNCGAGYTDVAVSPFGELKTCIDIDYPGYRILEGSLQEGWERIKHFVDNLRPDKDFACNSCELVAYCSWCPAKGYLENGDFSTCDLQSRQMAEFTKKIEDREKRSL